MAERLLHGAPASPGIAFGAAWRRSEDAAAGAPVVAREEQAREHDAALAALAAAALALKEVAAGLPPEQAEIVQAGILMAQDPALVRAIEAAIVDHGLPAAGAILRATGEHADAIASIDDETLAARADDVRSLGRRAARLTTDRRDEGPPGGQVILIEHELGPADVAELAPSLAGVALVGGGPTSHAAIVARSLGIPMVTGLAGPALEVPDGTPLAIDGSSGTLFVDPPAERIRAAAGEMSARRLADDLAAAQRGQPGVTADGRRVTVLANVASAAELAGGLRAGAEGIGLLRTELAFLNAADWPTEQQHTEALAPILAGLSDLPAVVRVLDFGPDKCPPFVRGLRERGVALLLDHEPAFVSQLRALVFCARDYDIRILLPMVQDAQRLTASRALLQRAARSVGCERTPPLGAMIETVAAAENAAELAQEADFLSIGTNDLTASALGADRFAANAAQAHHPTVLNLIGQSVEAARAAGIAIEVCGEAASDPLVLPLLIGLGVDQVSVGAARVGEVRRWIRRLSAADATGLARAALALSTAPDVELAVRRLAAKIQSADHGDGASSVEPGDGGGERV